MAVAQENMGYGRDYGRGRVRVYKWEAPSEAKERYHASVYSWTPMGDDIMSEAGVDRCWPYPYPYPYPYP